MSVTRFNAIIEGGSLKECVLSSDYAALEQRVKELEEEKEKITENTIKLLTDRLCEKHIEIVKRTSFYDFYQRELSRGCKDCIYDLLQSERERREKAEKQSFRLIEIAEYFYHYIDPPDLCTSEEPCLDCKYHNELIAIKQAGGKDEPTRT